jgi:hypothetical protein
VSGPEGTPNGVDRLAHVRAYLVRKDAPVFVETFDALVEIAKQARRVVRCIDVERDVPYATAEALRSALARLDSGVDACPACGNNELCSVCLGEDSLLRPEGDRG